MAEVIVQVIVQVQSRCKGAQVHRWWKQIAGAEVQMRLLQCRG